ncbi:MAG: DUF1572 family protein [Saprospiraceae bacterium]|nr:DUF1572 family protein [Saprospiraceae bacterium]
MALQAIITLFQRDLSRLKKEISLYHNEHKIWCVENEIPNSAGNLCLHLVGNLNSFIGNVLGHTGYQRQREQEFQRKDIPRAELIQMVDDTIKVVTKALENLDENDLQNEYPVQVFEKKTSTEFFLIHLTTHLGYHLGQINYHRRLLDAASN